MKIQRLTDSPIIYPDMDDRMGSNLNGPSLIRVPEWVKNPLGKYYLYFAHHQGLYIRVAYADNVSGPYTIHSPGALSIEHTPYERHIASPDVHVDNDAQMITMLYHGSGPTEENDTPHGQITTYAQSKDGLMFESDRKYLAESYLRTFQWQGWYYGFSGGPHRVLSRTRNLREAPECGIMLNIGGEDFTDFSKPEAEGIDCATVNRIRHVGFHLTGNTLAIYYSSIGDEPERIKRTKVDISGDWSTWRGSNVEEVLRSETELEGMDKPIVRSSAGWAQEPVHELRDPYIFEEDGRVYLLYSVAGERGIAIAEFCS